MKTKAISLAFSALLTVAFVASTAAAQQQPWTKEQQQTCSALSTQARVACAQKPAVTTHHHKATETRPSFAPSNPTSMDKPAAPAINEQIVTLIGSVANANAEAEKLAAEARLADAQARLIQAQTGDKLVALETIDAQTRRAAQEAAAAAEIRRIALEADAQNQRIPIEWYNAKTQRKEVYFGFLGHLVDAAGYAGGQALRRPDSIAITGGGASVGPVSSGSTSASTSASTSNATSSSKSSAKNNTNVDVDVKNTNDNKLSQSQGQGQNQGQSQRQNQDQDQSQKQKDKDKDCDKDKNKKH